MVDAGTELALLDTVQPENDEYSWYQVWYDGETDPAGQEEETPETPGQQTETEVAAEIPDGEIPAAEETKTEPSAAGVIAYVRSDLADLKTEETETETETEAERKVIEIPADGVILRRKLPPSPSCWRCWRQGCSWK